jgi:DNA invertase Pin-like site-specific DNA recombinase
MLNIQERNAQLKARGDKMGYHSAQLDKIIETKGSEDRQKFFKSISRVHKNDHSEI